MTFDWSVALAEAIVTSRLAGTLLRDDLHRPGGPRGKIDKAEADVEAETLIRERLCTAFPSWGFLGEETGRQTGASAAPVWLVDPNDGTRDYLTGRRGSAVSIGLVFEAQPVLGVVYAFAYPDDEGDLFAWAQGCGPLLRNGRPTPGLRTRLGPTESVLVSAKGDHHPSANLHWSAPGRFRAVPSIAHRLALVAAGEAAVATSLYAPQSWDYAGGHALVRGAGGAVLDEHGEEVRYEPDGSSRAQRAFAATPALAAELAARSWERLDGASRDRVVLARPALGSGVRDSGRLSRAQGCLLGQIAGDSLGAPYEGSSAAAVAACCPPGGPRALRDVTGARPTLAGQPTDDSELALALARTLVQARGFDAAGVRVAYEQWLASEPPWVGRTTRAALSGQSDATSQANGALMRVSPLGILAHASQPEQAAAWARAEAALTHPHPVCADASAAFVVAVAHAIAHGDGPERAYEAAHAWARTAAHGDVRAALERASQAAPVCDTPQAGYVLIALQNAFFRLLHEPNLEAALAATVLAGGDTDTNAAIAGALLGAVHGRRALPDEWRTLVLSCRAHPARTPRPRPPAYWPTDVLELAECLLLARANAHGG